LSKVEKFRAVREGEGKTNLEHRYFEGMKSAVSVKAETAAHKQALTTLHNSLLFLLPGGNKTKISKPEKSSSSISPTEFKDAAALVILN